MRSFKFPRVALFVAFGSLMAACSDSPIATAPVSNTSFSSSDAHAGKASKQSNTLSSGSSQTSVNVLTRKKAIADMTASAVIGSAGGTVSLPGAGFTLLVPPNAVSAPTTFSVHALAGKAVAYEFEPHGTSFTFWPIFKQDLTNTNMAGLTWTLFEGGYFANSAQIDLSANTANVDQLFTTGLAVDGNLYFALPHFSGYLVSSGRRN